MLRTVGDAPTLWESILSPAVLEMPEELERIDRLLDDPRCFEDGARSPAPGDERRGCTLA
jgi:hypothetical protein